MLCDRRLDDLAIAAPREAAVVLISTELDTKPLDNPQVRTLLTDITDSGQVFNALSSYMGLREFDPSLRPQPE